MKIKPKEVLINLPIALLFNSSEQISDFAANINTLLFGKVKMEELGTLGHQYVGLFYLQRNVEYFYIRNEFIRLIENELISNHSTNYPVNIDPSDIEEKTNIAEEHKLCLDCDQFNMLHLKELNHCWCGEDWINGKCQGYMANKH